MLKDSTKLMMCLITMALPITAWLYNFYKFTDCDFESSYKCEAVHGIGVVIPPTSLITVWFDTDSKQ